MTTRSWTRRLLARPASSPDRCRPRLEALEDRLAPTTYPVTTLIDGGPGSLRQAILDANANPDGDEITFRVTGTITLGGNQLPAITGDLTVTGPGADLLTVNADRQSRVLQVGAGATVGLSGLTLANGNAGFPAGGGGVLNEGTLSLAESTVTGNSAYVGGGVLNEGTLSVTGSTVSNNSGSYCAGIFNRGMLSVVKSTISGNAGGFGGGISNYDGTASLAESTVSGNSATLWGGGIINSTVAGTMSVTNSTISGNSTGYWGGGIYNTPPSPLSVTDSTISGNSAGDIGGGICNEGPLTVTNSTISGNTGGFGGGISTGTGDWGSTLALTNSTISGNTATVSGGGIWSVGRMWVTNSTISGNAAPGGGGVYSSFAAGLANSIVGGNTLSDGVTPGDLAGIGVAASSSYNLIGPGGSGGLVTGVNGNIVVAAVADLCLGALAENGGPTRTHALLPGSPAVNAGDPAATEDFDQRGPGFARVVGGRIDIGAYEVQAAAPTVASVTVNNGAAQRSKVTEIIVTFDMEVDAALLATAFTLTRPEDGAAVGAIAVATQVAGGRTVATLTFSGANTEFGSLADGRWVLSVDDAKVKSPAGAGMAADYSYNLHRLFGDVNGDAAVNGFDYSRFRQAYGSTSESSAYRAEFDFNVDGAINGFDYARFRTRYGTVLP